MLIPDFGEVRAVLSSSMWAVLGGGVALIMAFGILIFGIFSCSSLPSDDVLISRFDSNKACLEQLLKMSNEDEEFTKITRVMIAPTYAGDLSLKRKRAYWDLFDKGGLQYGVERSDNGDVFFVVSTSYAGDYKGYARLQKRPFVTLADLDKHSIFGFWCDYPQAAGGGAFRDLGNGWYLWRGLQF